MLTKAWLSTVINRVRTRILIGQAGILIGQAGILIRQTRILIGQVGILIGQAEITIGQVGTLNMVSIFVKVPLRQLYLAYVYPGVFNSYFRYGL